MIQGDRGHQQCAEDTAPRNVKAEGRRHVHEQHRGQQLQISHIAMIGDDHLRDEAGDAEQQRIEQCRSADGETQGFAHGRKVGRDVDGVGNHQQQDERIEHERRKLALDVAGQPTARAASRCRR